MNLIEKNWNEILEHVRKEHELSDVSFETWLLPLKVHSAENHVVKDHCSHGRTDDHLSEFQIQDSYLCSHRRVYRRKIRGGVYYRKRSGRTEQRRGKAAERQRKQPEFREPSITKIKYQSEVYL